jgi:hypothetical protein
LNTSHRASERRPGLRLSRGLRDDIIEAADTAGADNVQISLNRGVLPHEMFMEQIRRFARDVLPPLQAHKVGTVPLAEAVPA